MTASLLLAVLGCAARSAPESLSDPPAWTTDEGIQTARTDLVRALLSSNQPEAALQTIHEMRTVAGADLELDILQAQALRSIGLYEDAEMLLQSVLKRQRRSAAVHNQLGILYMDQQRLPEAVEHFRSAHRFAPKSAEYANNFGFALISAGQPTEAIEVLRSALKQDATRVRTRNNFGFALIADQRSDEAYRVFRSSNSEDEARYNLGVGLELSGATTEAAAAYTAALASNPDHARAQAALQRIQPPLPLTDEAVSP
jgi:Tfp pilus assembly protein PilF